MNDRSGSDAQISPRVRQLAAAGAKIAAIKLYRRESGAGLKQAKHVVDQLALENPPGKPPALSQGEASGTPSDHSGGVSFLAATVLGLIGIVVMGYGIVNAHLSAAWPQVSGVITRAEQNSSGRPEQHFRYTYRVDDQALAASRISFAEFEDGWFAERARGRYAEGDIVTVYYDPRQPERSVLESRVSVNYATLFFVCLLAFSWGVKMWRRSIARENRLRSSSRS